MQEMGVKVSFTGGHNLHFHHWQSGPLGEALTSATGNKLAHEEKSKYITDSVVTTEAPMYQLETKHPNNMQVVRAPNVLAYLNKDKIQNLTIQ